MKLQNLVNTAKYMFTDILSEISITGLLKYFMERKKVKMKIAN